MSDVTSDNKPADGPRFETLLEQLEGVVVELERGELSLEQALSAFERGMGLSKNATALLDAAQARVSQLIEARDGSLHEAPFEG